MCILTWVLGLAASCFVSLSREPPAVEKQSWQLFGVGHVVRMYMEYIYIYVYTRPAVYISSNCGVGVSVDWGPVFGSC